jgi:hypothetical protein
MHFNSYVNDCFLKAYRGCPQIWRVGFQKTDRLNLETPKNAPSEKEQESSREMGDTPELRPNIGIETVNIEAVFQLF